MTKTISTEIGFGGFYNTIHDAMVNEAVASELGLDIESDEANQELWDYPHFAHYQHQYCMQWLWKFNGEFETEIRLTNIASPKEYNFDTDVMLVEVSDKDFKTLITYIKDNELKEKLFETIRVRTTSRDGYAAFYKYHDYFLKEHRYFLLSSIFKTILDHRNKIDTLYVESFWLGNCVAPEEPIDIAS